MQKRTKNILLMCSITLGLLLATSPFLVSYAQKKTEIQKVENQNQDAQDERTARQEIAESVVGTILLDTLTVKEPDWILKKSNYFSRASSSESASTGMLLKKDELSIGIDIGEYDSVKDTVKRFTAPRSYGASVIFNTYGDRGEKLIGQNGDFLAIRFQKGNFFVSIYTEDEKRAERFAGYMADVLNNLTDK